MKTVNNLIEFEKNSLQQAGEDIINFAQPLAITDDSRQWNMTKYDVNSLDITTYDGTVTADHGQNISDVIGKVINLRKEGNKVLIDGIKFAIKENPLAVLAKNLMKGGFVTGVSIETIGDEADDTLTWKNHKLAGLSVVAHPNNKNAYAVIANSLQEAKKLGLNTNGLELLEKEKSIYFSDKKDYNLFMETNGGPGSGNFAPGQGRGVGKPGSSSSKLSSLKEQYEKIKTQIDNADLPQNVGQNEKKELDEARKAYRTELIDSIQSLNDDISNLQNEANEIYDEIDELESEYDEAREMGDYAEAEDIRFEIKDKETLYDSDISRIDELKKEVDQLQGEFSKLIELPSERFEREKDKNIPSLTEEERKNVSKTTVELQKKIDAITKKFGNSISEQIQDNSNRLTKILNAQSKGNPYHDKEGRFCSGPGAAFGAFGEHGGFSRNEAARYLQLYRSGEQDIVMTRMNDDNLIASAECAKAASQMYDDAYYLLDSFGEDAEKFSSVKKAKDINYQLLNLGYHVNKIVKKYAQSNDNALLSKLKSYSDRAEKLSKSASLLEKQKKSAVENNSAAQTAIAYAKLAGEAVPAIYSTMNYIDKNLEKEPRYFETK